MNITKQIEKEVRSFAIRNSKSKYIYTGAPIFIKDGNTPPYFKGNTFRYETKTGKPVYYPSAYMKAWGKPIYIPSTRHIVVGKEWLRQLEIDLIQVKLCRQRKRFVHQEIAKIIYLKIFE